MTRITQSELDKATIYIIILKSTKSKNVGVTKNVLQDFSVSSWNISLQPLLASQGFQVAKCFCKVIEWKKEKSQTFSHKYAPCVDFLLPVVVTLFFELSLHITPVFRFTRNVNVLKPVCEGGGALNVILTPRFWMLQLVGKVSAALQTHFRKYSTVC